MDFQRRWLVEGVVFVQSSEGPWSRVGTSAAEMLFLVCPHLTPPSEGCEDTLAACACRRGPYPARVLALDICMENRPETNNPLQWSTVVTQAIWQQLLLISILSHNTKQPWCVDAPTAHITVPPGSDWGPGSEQPPVPGWARCPWGRKGPSWVFCRAHALYRDRKSHCSFPPAQGLNSGFSREKNIPVFPTLLSGYSILRICWPRRCCMCYSCKCLATMKVAFLWQKTCIYFSLSPSFLPSFPLSPLSPLSLIAMMLTTDAPFRDFWRDDWPLALSTSTIVLSHLHTSHLTPRQDTSGLTGLPPGAPFTLHPVEQEER